MTKSKNDIYNIYQTYDFYQRLKTKILWSFIRESDRSIIIEQIVYRLDRFVYYKKRINPIMYNNDKACNWIIWNNRNPGQKS